MPVSRASLQEFQSARTSIILDFSKPDMRPILYKYIGKILPILTDIANKIISPSLG
jgi:hypothetical protein